MIIHATFFLAFQFGSFNCKNVKYGVRIVFPMVIPDLINYLYCNENKCYCVPLLLNYSHASEMFALPTWYFIHFNVLGAVLDLLEIHIMNFVWIRYCTNLSANALLKYVIRIKTS